jgi:phospholipid transport system substrate-binding protein
MRPVIATVFALMALLCSSTAARALSPTQELQAFFTETSRILDPGSPDSADSRLAAIRAKVHDIVDVRGAAEFSLGPSWDVRSPAEIEEFVPLFATLLEQSLITGLAARIRLPDGIQVHYLGESVQDAAATVWTTILSRSGADVAIDYRMIERNGRWAIRDVAIDGMSLAANYRAQFARVMQASSFAGLVAQIRARVPESAPIAETAPVVEDAAAADSAPVEVAAAAPAEPSTPPSPENTSARAAQRDLADARLQTEVIITTATWRGAAGEEPGAEAAIASPEPPAAEAMEPAAPAPVRGTARRSREPSYWVQVGAFRSVQSARRLAALVTDQERAIPGGSPVVIEPGSAEIPLSRVRIGPFAARARAAAKLREIEARGFQPFIAEQRD